METLTTREAVERVAARIGRGVALSTFHTWVADKRIRPTRKLPGRTGAYLFDADDVDRFADALADEAAA